MSDLTVSALPAVPTKRGPSAESVLRWMDLMESCEQLVLAGLRQRIGPHGDIDSAYRDWYARQSADRDIEIAHRLSRARRLGREHAN